MEFLKQFEQTINLLLKEVSEFKEQLTSLQLNDNLNQSMKSSNFSNFSKTSKIENETNLTNHKKLQLKETEYDQLNEIFKRNSLILQNETKINNLISQFQNDYLSIIKLAEMKKTNSAHKLNSLLIEMKQLEKEIKDKRYTKEYKLNTFENEMIQTEQLDQLKEEKKRRKLQKKNEREEIQKKNRNEYERKIEEIITCERFENVKNIMTIEEMILLEKEMKRYIGNTLFDSNTNHWKKGQSEFNKFINNQSNIIILIETIEKQKFGCYIQSEMNQQGKYIKDKNAFIFKITGNTFEKYPIVDHENAIKIGYDNDEELFTIGYGWVMFGQDGDIVIKKSEKRDRCSCTRKSFDYNGRENPLIGRKGMFEVKNILVISTIGMDEIKQQREERKKKIEEDLHAERNESFEKIKTIQKDNLYLLEKWANKKCDQLVFDSNIDDWKTNTSVFNQQIKGKQYLLFLIENDEGKQFGYYLNTEISEEGKQFKHWRKTDKKSFHFHLNSKNTSTEQMKYEIIDEEYGGYVLYENYHHRLIRIGDIILEKENSDQLSYVWSIDNDFKNHNSSHISNNEDPKNTFRTKRFLVIQMRNLTDEEKDIERQKNYEEIKMKNSKELQQLEIWTSLKCSDILFDSTVDDWMKDTSVFDDRIKGRKQLIFLIEDEDHELFGYYLNTKIKNNYNKKFYTQTDDKSFEFNLKSKNNRLLQPMKFEIKKLKCGYVMFSKSNEKLIELGNIILKKENDKQSVCYKNEDTYDNKGILNALCGKTRYQQGAEWKGEWFIPLQFIVIQMDLPEEQKLIRKQQEEKQFKQLEDWTNLQCGEIIFDSEKDHWKINKSDFDDKIIGKKQLAFIIEDEDGEKFGYYLNTEVKNKYNKKRFTETDDKSFEFNLESKGRLDKMMKFPIKNNKYGYSLNEKSNERLIDLGNIVLYKENKRNLSYCIQKDDQFDYQGISNALCGKITYKEENQWKGRPFKLLRIIVIQMKVKDEEVQQL